MTSYTVTGSATGAQANNGALLTVIVLTGAVTAGSQAGATFSSNPTVGSPPQQSITPVSTGSWVYGVLGNEAGNVDTAFTANGSTTFSANNSDATNFISTGTFRSTNTTTASSAVTLGATAPTQACYLSLVEIQPSGTLAEDGSAPAAGAYNSSGTSITCASFTPPAGSLLVAQFMSHSTNTGGNTLSLTSTPSLTWTKMAGDTRPAGGIWIAQIPGGGPTVIPLAGRQMPYQPYVQVFRAGGGSL